LRVWAIVGTILLFLIALPALAVVLASGWVRLAGQVILSIVLSVILVAFVFFAYVCMRAQARKWGTALVLAAIVILFLIYATWAGLPL
jgi:hypothetical protein